MLSKCIGVLRDLPPGFSRDAIREINQAGSLPWQENSYQEYTSQGYEVFSLFNKSGDPTDTIIEDCSPIPTPEIEKLPTIRSFLEHCNLSLMWVRLNRLAPGTCFWEHRDYSELSEKQKIRLHIPIITSPNSYMVFQDRAIHLRPDTLWLLRPDFDAHGFINGKSVRIHLIIDTYLTEDLKDEIDHLYLPEASKFPLPNPSPDTYENLLYMAGRLVDDKQEKCAEELLLKTFFKYNQPLGFSYDLIITLYKRTSMDEKVEEWSSRKYRFLHQEELQNVKRRRPEYATRSH